MFGPQPGGFKVEMGERRAQIKNLKGKIQN
jgi:hypothetical protein